MTNRDPEIAAMAMLVERADMVILEINGRRAALGKDVQRLIVDALLGHSEQRVSENEQGACSLPREEDPNA